MPFGSSVGEGIFYVMEVELAVNILQIVIVDECPQWVSNFFGILSVWSMLNTGTRFLHIHNIVKVTRENDIEMRILVLVSKRSLRILG